MWRAAFLWFQLIVGISLVGENLMHLRICRGAWKARDFWGLLVAAALTGIAILEIVFVAYPWLPGAVLWPTLVVLDLLAVLLYVNRVEPMGEWEGVAQNN